MNLTLEEYALPRLVLGYPFLSRTDVLALAILWTHTRSGCSVGWTLGEWADRLMCSRRTAMRSLRELEELGLVARTGEPPRAGIGFVTYEINPALIEHMKVSI